MARPLSDEAREAMVAGARAVILGAGGIGFDVAEFLVEAGEGPTLHPELWRQEWGVADPALEALSVGQKALVRLSPDQRERVKRQLRSLRGALAQG